MKYCFKIVLTLFLFSNISFSQFYAEDEISPYIIEFMKIADETTLDYEEYRKPQKTFTDEEIEHIAWLYYKCYNEDPSLFYNYVDEEHQKWEKRFLESDKKSEELRPWVKVMALRNRIADKYGISFTEVIITPVFLRCKFIKMIPSSLDTIRIISSSLRIDFIFLIEEVLKADNFFNIGDTLTIVGVVGGPENPRPHFESAKSYLIPVKPKITWRDFKGLRDYNGEFMFNNLREIYDVWVMGRPPKTFPIENEIIKECEYFGINDTSWVAFKKHFKETHLIFD